jgi:hypothetical protein
MWITSGALFAMLVAALAQLPVIGGIVVPVLLVQAGATLLHDFATRRRSRFVKIAKS